MFLKLFPRQFTDATALPAQPGRGVGPETRSFTYKAFRVLKGPVGCKTPPHRRKKAAPRVGGQQGSDRLRIQNKGDRIAACFSFGPVSKTVHLHDASFFWCGVRVCARVSLGLNSAAHWNDATPQGSRLLNTAPRPLYYISCRSCCHSWKKAMVALLRQATPRCLCPWTSPE